MERLASPLSSVTCYNNKIVLISSLLNGCFSYGVFDAKQLLGFMDGNVVIACQVYLDEKVTLIGYDDRFM